MAAPGAALFSIKSAARTHYITWISRPIDHTAYLSLRKWLLAERDYGPVTSERMKRLRRALSTLTAGPAAGDAVSAHSAAPAVPPDIDQAVAIRNVVIKGKIIKNIGRMNAQVARIAASYKAGNGILALAKAHDYPPLALLRGILLQLGYGAKALYNVFADKSPAEDVLSGRDLAQYEAAARNDAESTFNQQLAAEIAAENERSVVQFFIDAGIKLRTQDDLTAEQIAAHGRAVNTPDILFIDAVYIGGARVHWLDYKDYVGTDTGFLLSSNIKQAARYNAEWGPGAIAYHMSFVDNVSIPGALLLDARALPIQLRLCC